MLAKKIAQYYNILKVFKEHEGASYGGGDAVPHRCHAAGLMEGTVCCTLLSLTASESQSQTQSQSHQFVQFASLLSRGHPSHVLQGTLWW